MKAAPAGELTLWRNDKLFNIDFVSYSLVHHSFPRHFHDHFVIELVVKGADKFYCDGKTFTAQNEQLVLINPGEVHTGNTIADETLQYLSLCPTRQMLQEVAATLNIFLPANFSFSQTLATQPLLAKKLQQLFLSFQQSDGILKQEELFFEFMTGVFSISEKKHFDLPGNGNEDSRVVLLIDYIRHHFKEDISLEQMAALVCLNPFHLVRLFKRTVGVSPYNYLLIIRTEFAKELLRKGHKVNEAALAAGFYDSSHLHRLLRKFAGTSARSFLSSKGQYRTSFIA